MKDIANIVIRAQNGNRDAFGLLYENFYCYSIRKLIKKGCRPWEAEDIYNKVFIEVMIKIHQLKDPASFPGWLKSTLINTYLNSIKKMKPAGIDNDFLDTFVSSDSPVAEDVAHAEILKKLIELAKSLPCFSREALAVFYLGDYSLKESSAIVGVPDGTMKRRLHVARKRLKDKLKKLGITSAVG